MGRLSSKLRNTTDNGLMFWCPGCAGPHRIQHGAGAGPRWGWNGDVLRPTFTPSVLVTWTEPAALGDMPLLRRQIAQRDAGEIERIPQADRVCHSFVTDGRIQYLADCTHPLASQTVELPDWPASWGD